MDDLFCLGIKALIRNANGKILLLKVKPDLLKYLANFRGTEIWDIPGGRVRRGDSIEQTLVREVEEETGISYLQNLKPFTTIISNLRIMSGTTECGLILKIYTCKIRENTPIRLDDENSRHAWIEPKEAAILLQIKYPPEFTKLISNLK